MSESEVKMQTQKSPGEAPGKIWITVFTGNSGLTHYSFCLARALRAAGADVTLVTNRNYELDFIPTDFPVVRLFGRSRYYPLHLFRFWRLFRREQPSLVHYQGPLKFPALEMLLLRLQKRSGARLIYTAHDWLPHKARAWHAPLFRSYYRRFDRIIVHSGTGARFLEDRLGVIPGRIAVVPQGNYDFFNTEPALDFEAARERLGLDRNRFWYLFFGHIASYKGLDLAIEALSLAARQAGARDVGEGRPIGLLVAGNPGAPGMQKYEERIKELGLERSVSLHIGHIPVTEVQLYLKAAHALVLPYRESSTSAVVHLAMSFGKPVIASDVGGLAETVRQGSAGLIVPPGDIKALADAMNLLACDSETRRQLQSGREKAEHLFLWDNIAEQTMAVYGSSDKLAGD